MTRRTCYRPSATVPGHFYWHSQSGLCWSDSPEPPSAKPKLAIRTHAEVAAIMTSRGYPMGGSNVWQLERNALLKLRKDPDIKRLFEELIDQENSL